MKQRKVNRWQRLVLMSLPLLAVLALFLAGSLVLRGKVQAQDSNTITVASTARLIGRVALRIPVTVTCTIPEGATIPSSYGNVTVSQSGKEIVSASGYFSLTCDGTAHTSQVEMSPPAGSSPFHPGPAVANAYFYASYNDASGNYQSISRNTGSVTIRIVAG